jgi:hypothetical protein
MSMGTVVVPYRNWWLALITATQQPSKSYRTCRMTSFKKRHLTSHFRLLFQLENTRLLNSKDFVFSDIINHYHSMTKYTNFTVTISSDDLVTPPPFLSSVFTVPFPTRQKHLIFESDAAEVWRPISMQASFLQTTQNARSLEANWVIGVLKTVPRTIHSGVPSKSNLLSVF